MANDIAARLRDESSTAFALASIDPRVLEEAADTITRLRADLRAALSVLQALVNYDNGGSGDGGAILDAAEKILASHKENTDG